MRKNVGLSSTRALHLFAAPCIALAVLTGCGSGAVSAPPVPPTDPSAGTPVAVSPPVAEMFPDVPTTFTITGGTPGFSAFSSNAVALPVAAAVTGRTFTIVANAVAVDTNVDITVRDAANTLATARATIKPATINNQITFTPFAPTATGCGTNSVCTGGDAQVIVKAIQNGVILRNRPIRFDVFQGGFQLVTPGSNVLVNSLVINTDEQGEAAARVRTAAGVPTQVATLASTDTVSGQVRRYNFTIVQQISGTGVLSVLPSGTVTFTGGKGAPGQPGTCASGPGAIVDYYVYGGTAPYTVVSPLPGVATVFPSVVSSNGGRFTAQVNGCGTVAFIVTDATGRVIETAQLDSKEGEAGDSVIPPDTLTVAPTALTIACNSSGSVSVTGGGRFASSVLGQSELIVSPSSGLLPATVTITAPAGAGITSPVSINFVNGALTQRVVVTVTGLVGGRCP